MLQEMGRGMHPSWLCLGRAFPRLAAESGIALPPWARDPRGVIPRIFPVPGSNAWKLRHGTLGFVFHSRRLGWKNKEKEGESKSKQASSWNFVWSEAGKTDLYWLQEQLQVPGTAVRAWGFSCLWNSQVPDSGGWLCPAFL